MAYMFAKGLQDNGVSAMVKHFVSVTTSLDSAGPQLTK